MEVDLPINPIKHDFGVIDLDIIDGTRHPALDHLLHCTRVFTPVVLR